MDLLKIKNAANKALIAADAEYHSWPSQQQEYFRATMNEAAQNRVDTVLLKEIHGVQSTPESVGKSWDDLPPAKINSLNWAKLLTRGIGDDWIYLNESMAKNTSLLDFETLYDYDFDDHLFQEKTNKKEFEGYEGRDYYALRFSLWARLIINDQFYYATVYSLAGYLSDHLEDKGGDIIETLIPHDYVEGKDHGKVNKGGSLWDMRVDANGLEKQLDELKSRWHQYTQQRWVELSKQFLHDDPVVFMEDVNEDGELHRNFIFSNENSLKQIRWRHFLADCETVQADFCSVNELEKQEFEKAEHWLRETHQDIMQNFDPNVLTLKKKRKVVVAPGAFDGLSGDE